MERLCSGRDTGGCSMSEMAEPSDINRDKIINRIQNHEHRVLTTGEIAEVISLEPRSVRLNLKWMREHDILEGRRTTGGGGSTWVWWIDPTELSAGETVVTARHIKTLLSELSHARWEFQLLSISGFVALATFSITAWAVVLTELGYLNISLIGFLAMIGGGSILALLIGFVGLFLFPIETLGSWPHAIDESDEDE